MPAKKAKLGMTIQAQPTPPNGSYYQTLEEQIQQGKSEQQRLTQQGHDTLEATGAEDVAKRSQAKIPKVKPTLRKVDPQV